MSVPVSTHTQERGAFLPTRSEGVARPWSAAPPPPPVAAGQGTFLRAPATSGARHIGAFRIARLPPKARSVLGPAA